MSKLNKILLSQALMLSMVNNQESYELKSKRKKVVTSRQPKQTTIYRDPTEKKIHKKKIKARRNTRRRKPRR